LRGLFKSARAGVRQELKEYPDQLKEPARLRREDAAYGRLLAALDELVVVSTTICEPSWATSQRSSTAATSTAGLSPSTRALHGLLGQLAEGKSR
jgi:hypothetical protein